VCLSVILLDNNVTFLITLVLL